MEEAGFRTFLAASHQGAMELSLRPAGSLALVNVISDVLSLLFMLSVEPGTLGRSDVSERHPHLKLSLRPAGSYILSDVISDVLSLLLSPGAERKVNEVESMVRPWRVAGAGQRGASLPVPSLDGEG
ncbi:unnamed protein product [Pleuronectes platessa]|uniref:Uncharacterized protein n=1 Tax=Pleuronectes platessa TaxID=8262 RepID=A0A9N7UXA1_PLEPL|nr:unnamed protein product [Pleuronectes platessa]